MLQERLPRDKKDIVNLIVVSIEEEAKRILNSVNVSHAKTGGGGHCTAL
jgi:hypothetical protein